MSARSVSSARIPFLSCSVHVLDAVAVFEKKLVKVFAIFLSPIIPDRNVFTPDTVSAESRNIKSPSVFAVLNCAFVPDTVLLPRAIVLFVNVVVRESIHVFRNALRFVKVRSFRTFDAALSKILKLSASTGVVFPEVANCFVPSVASVSSPVFVPEKSEVYAIVPSESRSVIVLFAETVFVKNTEKVFPTFRSANIPERNVFIPVQNVCVAVSDAVTAVSIDMLFPVFDIPDPAITCQSHEFCVQLIDVVPIVHGQVPVTTYPLLEFAVPDSTNVYAHSISPVVSIFVLLVSTYATPAVPSVVHTYIPLFAGAASSFTSILSLSTTFVQSIVRIPTAFAVSVAPTPDAPLLYVFVGSVVVVASFTASFVRPP